MSQRDLNLSFKKFCPNCEHFQQQTGVCKRFYFNVRDYPNKFIKKCNGDYYKEDTTKVVRDIDKIDELEEKEEQKFKGGFKVYKHPNRPSVKIKQGFSWPGFFFIGLWAIFKGLWLRGIFLLFLTIIIISLRHSGPQDLFIVSSFLRIGLALFVGFEGNKWLEDKLHRDGYSLEKIETTGTVSPKINGQDETTPISGVTYYYDLKCPICGNSYPSKYYFKEDGVCIECHKKS